MLRNRLLRRASLILGSAIGVAACVTYEYGALMVGYALDGEVVDASTGQGIPDIQVESLGTTGTTQADGSWHLFTPADTDCSAEPCTVTATDVDGEANGAYLDAEASYTTSEDTGEGGSDLTDILIEMEPAAADTGG
jgi:hypothetical protein